MKAKGLLLRVVVTASAFVLSSRSAPFESWQGHDLDLGESRDALIFAQGKFWIRYAESNGGVWTSEDGLDWTRTPSGPAFYGGLAFGNGIFVAPSIQGNAVSPDGLAWKYSFYSGPVFMNDFGSTLAFGNGVFVMAQGAVNRPATLYSSVDGETWTQAYSLASSTNFVTSVSFVNDRFLASGGRSHALDDDFLLVSTNGFDWSRVVPAAGEAIQRFTSIAYSDGKYVGAGAEVVTFGLDGEFKTISRWNPDEGTLTDLAYADGKFVAVGDFAAYSLDGIAWQRAALSGIGPLSELAYGNGRFVAIGSRASAVSTNGIDWVTDGAALADVTGLVHAEGRFVAAGTKRFEAGSAIVTSTERGRWKARDVLPGTNRVTALGYAEGQFLAAAGTKAYTSSDAMAWRELETGFDGEIIALAHFNGRFWGAGSNPAGDGVIVEAVPDATWRIAKTIPGMPLAGIAAGGGRLVAIGGTNFFSGSIFSSANGSDWVENDELIFRPYSVAYLGGRFVIGGHFAGRAFSSDGVEWTQQADGQESLQVLGHTGAAYIAFHAIADKKTLLLVSPDARTWERRTIGSTNAMDIFHGYRQVSVGAIGSRRVVVVSGNVLYETEPLVPRIRGIAREGSALRLRFGENWTGEAAKVESSEDLQNWSAVPNISEANPVLSGLSAARQFYRVRAE